MKVITGRDILMASSDLERVQLLIQIIKNEAKYESGKE